MEIVIFIFVGLFTFYALIFGEGGLVELRHDDVYDCKKKII
jgi:hypothetical protein